MPAPDGLQGTDPFAVLGVPRDCTLEMLHQAYRASARRYHPDVNTEPSAVEHMRVINAAFVAARRDLMSRASATSLAASQPAGQRTDTRGEAPNPSPSPVESAATTPRRVAMLARQRILRARTSGMTMLRRQWPARAPGAADATATRRLLTRASGCVAGVAIVALAVLLVRFVAPSGAASPTQHTGEIVPHVLAINSTTSLPWRGVGRVDLIEHEVGPVPVEPGSRNTAIDMNWSADGNYVALSTSQTTGSSVDRVIVLKAQSGQQINALPGFAARWSPRGDQLAVLAPSTTGSNPQLELLDLTTLLNSPLNPSSLVVVPGAGQYLAWSPTGDQIAFSAQEQRALKLYDLSTQSVSTIERVPQGALLKPQLWLDDHTVLSLQVVHQTASLEAVDTTTRQPRTVEGLVDPKSPVAWSTGLNQFLYTLTTPGQATSTAYLQQGQTQAPEVIPVTLPTQFLVGWSRDDLWLSVAGPTQYASKDSMCLIRASTTLSPVSWDSKCLTTDGTLMGVTWETLGTRLSYVRQMPGQSTTAELREIVIRVIPQASTPAVGAQIPREPSFPDIMFLWICGALAFLGAVRQEYLPEDEQIVAPQHEKGVAGCSTKRTRRPRVGIISEALKWPPDEALKRTAYMLAQGLAQVGDLRALGTRGGCPGPATYPVDIVRANRTFVSWKVWRWLWRLNADVVVYLPGSGLTTCSLLRSVVLRLMCFSRVKRPVIVLVSIQPRMHHWTHTWLLRALAPVLVTVESPERCAELAARGIRTHLLAGGVDPIIFCPVNKQRRDALRRVYGIPADRFVILHVGHLKQSRNLDILKYVRCQIPEAEVVLVASTSTHYDQRMVSELGEAGVRIISRYVPHVEELYQIADCYVFPVQDAHGCAELPLSVLEALACGVLVVSTRFGSLPALLTDTKCIRYYESRDEMVTAIRAGGLGAPTARLARQLAMRHSWTQSTTRLANAIRSLLPDA